MTADLERRLVLAQTAHNRELLENDRLEQRLAAAELLADFALRVIIYPLGLAGAGEPVEGVRVQGIKADDAARLRNLAADFKKTEKKKQTVRQDGGASQ